MSMKSKLLIPIAILMLNSLTVANCRSNPTVVAINRANVVCTSSFESTGYTLEIPPEALAPQSDLIKIRGLEYVRTSRYNAFVLHARDLSACLEAQNCVARKLHRDYSCQVEAERNIHPLIPYALQMAHNCSIGPVDCKF